MLLRRALPVSLALATLISGCGGSGHHTTAGGVGTPDTTAEPASTTTSAAPTAGKSASASHASGGGSTRMLSRISTANDLVTVAGQTEAARSGEFTETIAENIDGESIVIPAKGSYDLSAHRMQLSVDMSTLMSTLGEGVGQTHSKSESTVQEVLANNSLYMKGAMFSAMLPDQSPKWIRMDLSAMTGSYDTAQLNSLWGGSGTPSGPGDSLAMLHGADGPVTNLGTASVDGVSTTHYAATIDLNVMAVKATGAERDAMRKIATASLVKNHKIPIEIWVAADGTIRREKMSMQTQIGATSFEGGLDVKIAVTVQFSHLGDPQHIAVPDPADTMSFAQYSSEAEQHSTEKFNTVGSSIGA